MAKRRKSPQPNPVRWVFGGTCRESHTRMSLLLAGFLMGLSTNAAWPLWLSTRLHPYFPALANEFTWLAESTLTVSCLTLIGAAACLAQEMWATADRDLSHQHWYWGLYGRKVKHRAWASHGFFIGTVIRLAYGWWWLLLPLAALWPQAAIAWCLGAFANDCGHLVLDL